MHCAQHSATDEKQPKQATEMFKPARKPSPGGPARRQSTSALGRQPRWRPQPRPRAAAAAAAAARRRHRRPQCRYRTRCLWRQRRWRRRDWESQRCRCQCCCPQLPAGRARGSKSGSRSAKRLARRPRRAAGCARSPPPPAVQHQHERLLAIARKKVQCRE